MFHYKITCDIRSAWALNGNICSESEEGGCKGRADGSLEFAVVVQFLVFLGLYGICCSLAISSFDWVSLESAAV